MDTLKALEPIFGLIISIATLIGVIIMVYRFSRDPDIEASQKISLIEQGCVLKHQTVNDNFIEISKTLLLIKDNDLKHIERDINEMKVTQAKILTILEAKYEIKLK